MKYCPYCGAVLPDGAFSFCPACGKALPEAAEEQKEKKSRPAKARKQNKPAPEPPVDDYDGYYDDRIPIDAGKRREGLDFGIVKKVIAIVACLLVVISACVALLYVLMREKFKKLPGVLQKQITSRLALGYVLLALGAALLASLRNILLCLPGFAAGAFLLVNAARLFFRAISGDCLYLHGVCKEIEKRKRILLEVEDKRIQIVMGKPIKGLCVGDAVMLTILADTPVYEQDGVYRVFSYIALERIEKD